MFKQTSMYPKSCSRPLVRHSLLLALEPRQVFDAAVGAAIAEALPAHQETAEHATDSGLEHDWAAPGVAPADKSSSQRPESGAFEVAQSRAPLPGTRAANSDPIFALSGTPSADRNTPFNLGAIAVNDHEGGPLTLTLRVENDGAFYQGNDGKGSTLSLNGTAAEINATLDGYTFRPAGNQDGTAVVIYTLKDAQGGITEHFFEIKLSRINIAPTVSIDGSAFADSRPTNSSGNIKGIQVADGDNDTLTVTITAAKDSGGNGSFHIGSKAGVTVENNGRDSIILKGKALNINSLLDTLLYTTPGGIGRVTITATVNDGTVDGTSASQVFIVNDKPAIVVNPDFTGVIAEYSYYDAINDAVPGDRNQLTLGGSGGISIDDANDDDTLLLEVMLIDDGTGKLGQLYIDGSATGKLEPGGQSYSIRGGRDAINAELARLRFRGAGNRYGDIGFKVVVTDSSGAVDEHVGTLSVTPINDPPRVSISADSAVWMNVFEGNLNPDKPEDAGTSANNPLTLEHLGLGGSFDGIADPDTPAVQVIITLKSRPEFGQLKKGGQLLGVNATFSLEDVQNGLITYEHSGDNVPANGALDRFSFSVDDGSGQPPSTGTVKIKLNPCNDDFSVYSENATATVGNEDRLTVWVWERQTDAGLSSTRAIDAIPGGGLRLFAGDDDPSNIEISFKAIPDAGVGKLYLFRNGVKEYLDISSKITGAELNALCFEATDAEPETYTASQRSFSLEFTDRWNTDRTNPDFAVDQRLDTAITKTLDIRIQVAPNNDDPVLGKSELGSPAAPVLVDHDASRLLPIDQAALNVTDMDSGDDTITFTLTNLDNLDRYGDLLFKSGSDLVKLKAGDSFSMADVKAGKLYFEYWRSGGATGVDDPAHGHKIYDITPSFAFTVQDGGVTGWLSDDGSGRYANESYHTSHEGGIYGNGAGVYLPDSPGVNHLQEQTFTMYLRACERGTTVDYPDRPSPQGPSITVDTSRIPLIYEGHPADGLPSSFTLTGGYSAGTGQVGGFPMILVTDGDTPPEQLVLSLLNNPRGGHVTVNGGRIFLGDSFTLAQLMAGAVSYVHGGGEVFHDRLNFAVSDGTHYVINDDVGARIALDVQIIPYDDAPRLTIADSSRLVVDEGGELIIKGQNVYFNPALPDREVPAAWTGVILKYYDPDGASIAGGDPEYTKDASTAAPRPAPDRTPGSFGKDQLKFIITGLPDPARGTLQYEESDGVWKTLAAGDAISAADLDSGRLKYVHGGGEDRSDSFTIQIRDESKEAGGPLASTLTVNLVVRAVNDAPVLTSGGTDLSAVVSEDRGAGGEVTILSLHAVDSDNVNPAQIIYRITEACSSGSLYRRDAQDVPLGAGSCFTQDELNRGLIYYKHSGKNQHRDSFRFVVTDNSLYYNADPDKYGQMQELSFNITVNPVNEAPSFSGMDRLEIYYKDRTEALQVWDENAADGKQYIMINDLDQSPRRGFLGEGTVSDIHDYMELTISATDAAGASLDYCSLSVGPAAVTGGLLIEGGTGAVPLALKGKRDDINSALEYLMFQVSKDGVDYDFDNAVKLHFALNDCNNGMEKGADGQVSYDPAPGGKALSASHDLIIHVSTENDPPEAPTNVAVPGTVIFQEDTPGKIFNASGLHQLQFQDVDAFDSTDNKLEIFAGHGSISFDGANIGGLAGASAAAGRLTLTGTLDALNTALEHVRYAGGYNYNGPDVVKVVYTDGGKLNPYSSLAPDSHSTEAQFDVTVTAVNDRPTATMNYGGVDGFEKHLDQVANGRFTPTVAITQANQGNGGYAIALQGKISIDDKSDFGKSGLALSRDDHVSATVSAALLYDGTQAFGSFSLDPSYQPAGFAVSGGDSALITLSGSWSQVQEALDRLTYTLSTVEATACQNKTLAVIVTVDDDYNGEAPASNNGSNKASASFLVNVNTGPNDAPVISGGDDARHVYEDVYAVKNSDPNNRFMLNELFRDNPIKVGDSDSFQEKMLFKLETSSGKLFLNGQEFASDSYYTTAPSGSDVWKEAGATLSQINAMLDQMAVQLDRNFNGELTLTLTVNDKGNTGAGPVGGQTAVREIKIEVHPVNDAPVTSSSRPRTLYAISEDIDRDDNAGQRVEDIFGELFLDSADAQPGQSEQAGSFSGVLVVSDASAGKGQGAWQYSLDGADWITVTGVGNGTALYLDKAVLLRFQPERDYNGDPGLLSVRLVENSPVYVPDANGSFRPFFGANSLSGQELVTGNRFNLARDNGDFGSVPVDFRPYTRTQVDLGIKVNAVNDALTISGGEGARHVYEDVYSTDPNNRPDPDNRFMLNELFRDNPLKVGDRDSFQEKMLFKLETSSGKLFLNGQEFASDSYYTTAPSGSDVWKEAGATLSQINDMLDNMAVQLDRNFNGELTLTLTVNDKGNTGSGPVGGYTDVKEMKIQVRPVNDAPWTPNNKPGVAMMDAIPEDVDDNANGGRKVEALFNDPDNRLFSDPNDRLPGQPGQEGSFSGVLVVGDASVGQGQGVWQYSLDGTDWIPVTGAGNGTALYLDKAVLLRFQPERDYNGEPGPLSVRLVENTPVYVPGVNGSAKPFFGDNSLTGQRLESGKRFDLTMTTGVFGSVPVDLRPYTANQVDLGIKVNAVNDAPGIKADSDYVMNEDGSLRLIGLSIKDSDVTAGVDSGSYSLTISASGHGRLGVAAGYVLPPGVDAAWNEAARTLTINGANFAQLKDLVEKGQIVFTPDDDYHSQADHSAKIGLTLTLHDGGNSGSGGSKSATATANITIEPVNDAPWVGPGETAAVVTDNPFMPLDKDSSGDALPAESVGRLFGGFYHDGKDANTAGSPEKQKTFAGVILEYSSSSAGVWQYSGDGQVWTALPGLSPGNGFFVRQDVQLRFVPNGTSGSASLLAHLADDSRNLSDAAQGSVTLSGRLGGTGDASEKTVTLTASTVADKRPVWQVGATAELALPDLNEDPLVNDGTTVGSIINTFGRDIDGGGLAGLLVTGSGNTVAGDWEYSLDGGVVWRTVSPDSGRGLFLDATARIRFNPELDYNGKVAGQLRVTLVDGDNASDQPVLPLNGNTVDLADMASNGFEGRYSVESRTLSVTVNPVNDAPATVSDEVELPGQNIASARPREPISLGGLLESVFSDAGDRSNGHAGNALNGVFVVGSQADPLTEGVWEYFDGSAWQPIQPDEFDDSSALYLDKAGLIRFKPVSRFTGRPGQLEARLVETDNPPGNPAHTGPSLALPVGLSSGRFYDLAPLLDATGHISGRVTLNITVDRASSGDVTHHNPAQELDLEFDALYRNKAGYRAHIDNESERQRLRPFERLGLDDPHVRNCGAVNGVGQEARLITDTYISNVNRFTTEHISQSVGQAFRLICQAAGEPTDALTALPGASGWDSPLALRPQALTDTQATPAQPEVARGDSDSAAFRRDAMDSFSSLWLADDAPPAEPGPALPGDRDLDDKIQGCSLESLLAESRAFLETLAS